MKPFRWSAAKNEELRAERGVTFERMVVAIADGGLVDVLEHPRPDRYPGQRILLVWSDGYGFLVPFVEAEDHLFLETVIPSRKATRDIRRRRSDDAEDR